MQNSCLRMLLSMQQPENCNNSNQNISLFSNQNSRLIQVRWCLRIHMENCCNSDDEAVSPVIATVLLLAITVMLSSMVFIMMQGAINSVEKSEPDITVSVKGLSNGFHVVRITSLDQALDPARLEYQIYNQGDLNSKEFSGFVDDPEVYGAVGTNVSFHDRDAGYSVTQGDYFVIDSQTIGSNDGTWSMKLIDRSSNVMLFDIKLVLIED